MDQDIDDLWRLTHRHDSVLQPTFACWDAGHQALLSRSQVPGCARPDHHAPDQAWITAPQSVQSTRPPIIPATSKATYCELHFGHAKITSMGLPRTSHERAPDPHPARARPPIASNSRDRRDSIRSLAQNSFRKLRRRRHQRQQRRRLPPLRGVRRSHGKPRDMRRRDKRRRDNQRDQHQRAHRDMRTHQLKPSQRTRCR